MSAQPVASWLTILGIWIPLILMAGVQSCSHSDHRFSQDANVRLEATRIIGDSLETDPPGCGLYYPNTIHWNLYENDSLIIAKYEAPFRDYSYSFWEPAGDTINIFGFFGNPYTARIGFWVHLIDKKPRVYFVVRPHLESQLSYTPEGPLEMPFQLEVDTFKIRLDDIPRQSDSTPIYGHIELKSRKFFVANEYENGKELPGPRSSAYVELGMYFIAGYCPPE